MLKEVGVEVESKRVLWVKPLPDYGPLFSIVGELRQDDKRRFWIEGFVARRNARDIEADTGQMSTGVEFQLPMSHIRGVRTMRVMQLKSEITQLSLSDPCRKPSVVGDQRVAATNKHRRFFWIGLKKKLYRQPTTYIPPTRMRVRRARLEMLAS